MLSPGLRALWSVASVVFGSIPDCLGRTPQVVPHPVAFSSAFQDSVSSVVQVFGPIVVSSPVFLGMGLEVGSLRVLTGTCAPVVLPGPLRAQAPSRGQLVL